MRRALGKGLSQLIADQAESTVSEIPISSIVPNRKQPRTVFDEEALKELANSIQRVGLLQPLVVRPIGDNRYEIIAGERRWRASTIAGLTVVPALIRATSDHGSLELALIENIQRENLSPLESAKAYKRLMDEFNLTQEDVAIKVGKTRTTVSNTVRLLRLPVKIQQCLEEGKITEGQARPLLSLSSEVEQLAVFDQIMSRGLQSREIEKLVQQGKGSKAPRKKRSVIDSGDPNWRALADTASERLGSPVSLSGSEMGGTISIQFFSEEDLIRIMDLLGIQI